MCDEIYTKNCHIVFTKHAVNETLQHCYTPLQQQCGGGDDDDQICSEYNESSCVTRYTGDQGAVTDCQKIPVTLCGDRSCSPVPGEQQCHDKVGSCQRESCC